MGPRGKAAGWLLWPLAHDRLTASLLLLVVVTASWAWLLSGSGTGMSIADMTSWETAIGSAPPAMTMDMPGMPGMAMDGPAAPTPWTPSYTLLIFMMWWVMMAGMMLPSAAPVILLYDRIDGRMAERNGKAASAATPAFMLGYLAVWGGFSLVAALLQWSLESLLILSPASMSGAGPLFAAVMLAAAGLYQLSPLKRACLTACQSPLAFLSRNWKEGRAAPFRMGALHGLYCTGCCAGLMLLLFFGGIMNLWWIVGLALLVAAEKLLPASRAVTLVSGILLLVWSAVFFSRWLA